MVQRKVPNKLGIQADHVKSEKRLGNLKPKPSSCQHQDGKNKVADLKKKMKKSRSIKPSDMEGLRSYPLRKTNAQPGKPPPIKVPAAAATPPKQSLIKTMDSPPNYMKSTSCSEARKESSQVSFRYARSSSDSNNLRRRNLGSSKLSSASSNSRTLTRTYSLKLVRTLTKTPSFKPARASVKKCSRVALCADMNLQRATCSSTLKDSKFPDYLTLNPGGTESEGTSVMKVCPYTYCSLNGHHHAPVPPLKRFLAARRRLLKAQKIMKLEALSPRNAKPFAAGVEEIETEHLIFNDKPVNNGVDLGNSPFSPLGPESMEIFIEIYAKAKGDYTGGAANFVTELEKEKLSSEGASVATAGEDDEKQVTQSLSDGSPHCEIDSDENLERYSDIISIEKDFILETTNDEMKNNDAHEDLVPILGQERSSPGSCNKGFENESENRPSVEVDDAILEAIDMEWEEGQFSTSEADSEAYSSMNTDDEFDLSIWGSSENDQIDLHEGPVISSNSDETVSNSNEKILAEKDDSMDTYSQVSESLSYDQDYFTEEIFEVFAAMEDEAETDCISVVTVPTSAKTLLEEPRSGREKMQENEASETNDDVPEGDAQVEDPKSCCIDGETDEALETIENSQFSFDEREQDHINKEHNGIQKAEDSESDQTVSTDDFSLEQELSSGEATDKTEEKEVADSNLLVGTQISGLLQVFGNELDDGKEDDNQNQEKIKPCQVNDSVEEHYSSQDFDGESSSTESQDQLSDSDCHGETANTNSIENQSSMEGNQDDAKKFKSSSSLESEEQNNSTMPKTFLAENSSEVEIMKEEEEDSAGSDEVETSLTRNDKTHEESVSTFSLKGSAANNELPSTCNNRKWTIGCKKHNETYEEERKFNPREPNYLPLAPEPDPEKVDLRHQMMDERKNSEEWMIDYALQQTVTKLAPARKRKVALLVEAFETVTPVPKFEPHLRHTSTAFAHVRPIQACS